MTFTDVGDSSGGITDGTLLAHARAWASHPAHWRTPGADLMLRLCDELERAGAISPKWDNPHAAVQGAGLL
ncbi:hypothetical protein [Mycobacteroides abscessus]|uniref:hypothetical protein n=1 Tax=Mycobacteroides abscessus TaxID=36809 RepID=UPI000C257586|nr:hypothetical protein [Mycobacteroides abscessus]